MGKILRATSTVKRAARKGMKRMSEFELWMEKTERYLDLSEQFFREFREEEIDMNQIDPNHFDESLSANLSNNQGQHYEEVVIRTYKLFEEIFERYVGSLAKERALLRSLFKRHAYCSKLLTSFVGYIAGSIKSANPDKLRCALAAASVDSGSADFRDLWLALGSLYLSSANEGIDSSKIFRQIAQLDANETSHSDVSKSSVLSAFLESEYLRSLLLKEPTR